MVNIIPYSLEPGIVPGSISVSSSFDTADFDAAALRYIYTYIKHMRHCVSIITK